jgi:hypothetical protein
MVSIVGGRWWESVLGGLTSAVEIWKDDYGGDHASFVDNLPNERSFRNRGG